MFPLANLLTSGIWPVVWLLLAALVPLLLFVWIIHVFEKLMQQRLASRFGWNAVMFTGWLGTPIHELSHALMCVLFRHDIVELELFKPDRRNGRLGYVTHTYTRGNRYQELGTFFIGIAPLLGGTAAFLILLMVFFQDVGREALFSVSADQPLWSQISQSLQRLVFGLFEPRNLASWRLWLFLYLIICVGSHMAPSWSDYEGGMKGGLLILLLMLLASLLIAWIGPDTSTILSFARPLLVPVITAMIVVVVLVAIATAVVFLLTAIVDRVRGR
jgi:ABC-type multidrug transport system fused ATPase/permease subunit